MNIAVFASTKGTDLQAIIEAIQSGRLPGVDLKFVLSNRQDCYALARAAQAGIKTFFVNPQDEGGRLRTREDFDRSCLKICRDERIDVIVLIGYMRIISPVLIVAFPQRIMNIHPSLLPKYPGIDLDVHQAVLTNKEKESGCTLHWVTDELDAGPIIIQEKVPIAEGETVDSLKAKIQLKEQAVILQGLEMCRDGLLKNEE